MLQLALDCCTVHCKKLAAACLPLKRELSIETLLDGLQVTDHETIIRAQQDREKVRRLGWALHLRVELSKCQDGQDIEDPLYGNMGHGNGGGANELVRFAAHVCCVVASNGCEVTNR